jgi:hypothetical protein
MRSELSPLARFKAMKERLEEQSLGRRRAIVETFYDTFQEALAYDLDTLNAHAFDIEWRSGEIMVRREAVLPLIALLTDAKIRYGLQGWELAIYGAEALGVIEPTAGNAET